MHEKLTELKMKSEEMKEIKNTLLSWVKEEVGSGKECFHVESVGEVVDMIKDLAEAEKECAEACYYMIVSSAMLEGEEEPSYGMGYNHRHMSNGQFASSGKGHMVYGYHKPYIDQEPYINGYLHDPNFKDEMKSMMGYDSEKYPRKRASKYGEAYDDYQAARRHYTVSKKPESKEMMNEYAMKHVDNVLESLEELWESSDDVMLKKEIVDEMSKILNAMKTQK